MTWEIDYKLAVLRACNLTAEQIMEVDLTSVDVQVYGSDGSNIGGGCDTCGYGSSDPSMNIYVYFTISGKKESYNVYGPSDVAEFFRRVLSP